MIRTMESRTGGKEIYFGEYILNYDI